MMKKCDSFYTSLKGITGDDFASDRQAERYLYGRDSSAFDPGYVDYVVVPGSADEVREIVRIAGKNRIPITVLGAGLNLAGLAVPSSGGIVVDMKRLDNIVKVDEESRYAVVEAGVTIGGLNSYLKKNHPCLRFSIADAPPTSTVVGNMLTSGNGHLCKYGVHSEMINGMEVVLPDGDMCLLGSCSLSDSWHGQKFLPDLSGIFTDWFGATGIVTKISVKLYPRHVLREVMVFMVQSHEVLDNVLKRLTFTESTEDLLVMVMERNGVVSVTLLVYLTADTDDELDLKNKIIENIISAYKTKGKRIIKVPSDMLPASLRKQLLKEPKGGFEEIADSRKGGGFNYVGAFFPYGRLSEVYKGGIRISKKYGFSPNFAIRNVGIGHGLSISFSYPFNRADKENMNISRKASADTVKMCLEFDGIPWKPTAEEQRVILEKMDPATVRLMKRIKKAIDPLGIMNPGIWESTDGS